MKQPQYFVWNAPGEQYPKNRRISEVYPGEMLILRLSEGKEKKRKEKKKVLGLLHIYLRVSVDLVNFSVTGIVYLGQLCV